MIMLENVFMVTFPKKIQYIQILTTLDPIHLLSLIVSVLFFHYIDNIILIFEVENFHTNISNKEIYVFLQSFLWINVYFEYEKRLQVLISKNVMKIYLEEADRLSWLDVSVEDIFDENYINPEG